MSFTHFIPLAAAAEDLGHSHSVADALPHLGGMLMVLITLACLWCLTAIVAKLVAIRQSFEQSAPEPAHAVKPAAAAADEPPQVPAPHAGISPEIVAIISAAIACMHGGSRRVISIKPADTSWEKAGRQSVLTSHRIR
ncbi:MAG TPA: OadG family transporter subunit [Luteolibacter sp.]|nr:OadG family transporter subunit [Luteolibacter sp.]